MLSAELYNTREERAWNAFNAEARNGHLLFDRRFMGYHADRFIDASLIFRNGDKIVGLLSANSDGSCIHSHQGLTFGGLVIGEAGCVQAMEMLDVAVRL